jgi:hypothetical protein
MAPSVGACGEEAVEDLRPVVGRDAFAIVDDFLHEIMITDEY